MRQEPISYNIKAALLYPSVLLSLTEKGTTTDLDVNKKKEQIKYGNSLIKKKVHPLPDCLSLYGWKSLKTFINNKIFGELL